MRKRKFKIWLAVDFSGMTYLYSIKPLKKKTPNKKIYFSNRDESNCIMIGMYIRKPGTCIRVEVNPVEIKPKNKLVWGYVDAVTYVKNPQRSLRQGEKAIECYRCEGSGIYTTDGATGYVCKKCKGSGKIITKDRTVQK